METFEQRQKRENARQYRQWLSAGFQGEMTVDKNGWCTNGISFYKDENVKKKGKINKKRMVKTIILLKIRLNQMFSKLI